ncbi:alpha,alpha-trehalose-phosphate synthase [Citrobacter rodentium]|uniref:Trehalose-6-phosphate synthase n=2 Tax=Citrobacter rodentium TaxID=67825 RepID=D2TMZ1_CITRI|nr:alpha,alpha-trehalose-phosphate synthase [Citrobacter rodentium]KIQ49176.1 trehalose-6-phosphate synthase [Citrobacter rodentium]QBY28492.1 alpha,alpha-trehalose-phosphate synthase [Citrobacter rodentium]UHO29637.1 alpha,alpha-trehalose-phosphate synthase [Citrobacter rodentium NBRC 105723 = DSM 16636]CBG88700.1 alpha,alpha-trehalose-phosphate synthase [UDP-forming] [Citrobacter rodentium ICC168]HAT8014934.1 alpha,alpha-trehalose-phosphate synthase [Citrobacter rodentium NBRC 105723 = DSM 1
MSRLVVVSNRIAPPDNKTSAGGLAVGVLGALKAAGGLWFGWSGELGNEDQPLKKVTRGNITWASFNLNEQDHEEYYNQFSNAVLWPAFHYRLDLVNFQRSAWEGYQRVNALLADKLLPLLKDDDIIWIHDYHLLPFASELRKRGVNNRIGFFLHIPFPTPEIFNALPCSEELLEQLCDYDLLGFQTENDRLAFLDSLSSLTRIQTRERFSHSAWGKNFHTQVYPIGIEPDEIAQQAAGPLPPKLAQLKAELKNLKNIFSVERLDYSKGLPERFQAYEALLEKYPQHHGKIRYTQIAPTSRGDVQAYQDIRHQLETEAGRINGKYGQLGWTPLFYLNQHFDRKLLMKVFRYSDVGLVTPLRDGMNLVAKEFVAAQDPANPGVLVLSQFAGAANELTSALIVNPYDRDEVAAALDRALTMPLAERISRHAEMLEVIVKNDINHWQERFIADLKQIAPRSAESLQQSKVATFPKLA